MDEQLIKEGIEILQSNDNVSISEYFKKISNNADAIIGILQSSNIRWSTNINLLMNNISLNNFTSDKVDVINYLAFRIGYKFEDKINDIAFIKKMLTNNSIILSSSKDKLINGISQDIFKTEEDFEVIKFAMLNNYLFSNSTPEFIKYNSRLISYLLNDNSINDKRIIASIVNNTTEEILTDNDNELIKKAIQKGYVLSYYSPSFLKSSTEFIKIMFEYSVDNSLSSHIISNMDESLFSTSEGNEICELAIEHGYIIDQYSPDILKSNPLWIEKMLDNINDSETANEAHSAKLIIHSMNQNVFKSNNIDRIIRLAIQKGYVFSDDTPNEMSNNVNYVLMFLDNNTSSTIDFYFLNNFSLEIFSKEDGIKIINKIIERGCKFTCKSFKGSYKKDSEYLRLIISSSREGSCSFIVNDNDVYLDDELFKLSLVMGYEIGSNTPQYIKNDINKMLYVVNNYVMDAYYSLIVNSEILEILGDKLSETQKKCISFLNMDKTILNEYKLMKLSDFEEDYWNNKKILLNYLFKNIDWNVIIKFLGDSKNNEFQDCMDEKQSHALKQYLLISDAYMKKQYSKNIAEHFEELDVDKIDKYKELLERIFITNSNALYSMRSSFAYRLIMEDNPIEIFDKLEKLYIQNSIPMFAKMYFCFKILYPNPDSRFDFSDLSRISPELKNCSLPNLGLEKYMSNPSNNDIRDIIIYNDLLRIAVESNSYDLRNYLNNIELGNYLFLKIKGDNVENKKFDKMTTEQKNEALKIFVRHLEVIYRHTKEGKLDKSNLDSLNYMDKIQYLKDKIKPTNRYDLPDRIVRMFGYNAGYKSFSQIREAMKKSVIEAHERGKKLGEYLENHPFQFQDGDFIRCIGGYREFSGSLDMGNFCKEFLTVINNTSKSDTTPLDIDLSQIINKGTIYKSIEGTPTGFGFGNVFFITLKDNPYINVTRDKEGNLTGNKYDPKKTEMFGTQVNDEGYESHWGARTGMSISKNVDIILYKENRMIDSKNPYDKDGNVNYIDDESKFDDLARIKFDLVRHGYYKPIIDFSGKLLFTVKEFEELKTKMNGLSYYDIDSYQFSNNLDFDGINQITDSLEQSTKDTKEKRDIINNILTNVLSTQNLTLKTFIDCDLTPGSVEVIDTGSTSRFTNNIGSGDFDLILRVDQEIFRNSEKYKQFKNSFLEYLTSHYQIDNIVTTDNGDYRFTGIHIDSNTTIDLDLSFVVKTDKLSYTTEQCINDRLNIIKKTDCEKYKKVIANIVTGKKLMKYLGCYMPARKDSCQGGMGGVGIENWILQNNGSLIDACKSFYECAKDKDFAQFRKKYFVWDFGQNHFAIRNDEYPFDDFIYNMNETGYNKLKNGLKQILPDIYNIQNFISEDKKVRKVS
ncbi:MAG: hypothetical protein IJR82_02680 [Bacilli bacterium]|nr:hypothetical protein [Bacilli bacterium]